MIKKEHIILMTVVFVLLIPVLVLAGTVELSQTGQTDCYDSSGAAIVCSGTGQDGDIRAGVAWPSQRFTVSTDGYCVTDNLTGLMWVRSPDSVPRTWQQALDYANGLRMCGYSDWYLPNVIELESLLNAGQSDSATWLNTQGFINVFSHGYWSSTSAAIVTYSTAWNVFMWGYVGTSSKSEGLYVWPVRSEQPGGSTQLRKTGQKTCHDNATSVISCAGTGEDGEIQAGVSWPSPRFTVRMDGYCVTDNLTDLMWVRSPDNVLRTWQQALDYANGLSLCSYTDWRLPNGKELFSIVDFSLYDPVLTSGHPFLNVQSSNYWSSTSKNDPRLARTLYMLNGTIHWSGKTQSFHYAWPVRSGKVGTSGYPITGIVTEYGIGIAGVTMTLSGTTFATTTTEADGTYKFPGLADGNYMITPYLMGYTFTPSDRSVSIDGAGITGVNFSGICADNAYYQDMDNDTYGNASVTTYACIQPSGYVSNSVDCNDDNASINPGATETLNSIDDNCNGQVDEGLTTPDTNNLPTKPILDEPANGAIGMLTTVTLKWEIASDADGDSVTYKLYIGTETSFVGVTPVIIASVSNKNDNAMAMRYSMGLIGMLGIVTIGGLSRNRRKIRLLIIPFFIISAFIFTSCSGGGGNNNNGKWPSEIMNYKSYTVVNLIPNTTYYWKVVADDGQGGINGSEIYSFKTGS